MSTNTTRPGGAHENGIARCPLTPSEQKIFAFIVDYKVAHDGAPPTNRQIMAGVGLASPSTVFFNINGLVAKGYLVKDPATGVVSTVGGSWTPPDLRHVGLEPHTKPVYIAPRRERCRTCGSPKIHAKGECQSCYDYRKRRRTPRPRRLWRTEAPFGYCECGNGAFVIVMTAHGEMPLCRSCARIELEPTR